MLNILHFNSAMNSSIKGSILQHTYEYLNMYNDMSIDNIVVLVQDNDSVITMATQNDFVNFLSFNNKMGSYFSCQHDTETETMQRIVQKSKNSIFILFDIEQCDNFKQAFYTASDNIYDQNSWLFVLSTKHKEEDLRSVVSGLIDSGGIRINSQIYFLIGNDSNARLIEVYRECQEKPVSFRDLMIFPYNGGIHQHAEFIWKRRQNLHSCSIRVAYINTALSYEINDMHTMLNGKMLNSLPSHCIDDSEIKTKISGKTFCSKSSFISHFSSIVQGLNVSVEWVHSEDNNYGKFDEKVGNWNGIVGLLATNKAETSAVTLVKSESRSRAVSFSLPIYQYKHKLYMARPTPSTTWNTFVMILSYKYWMAIVGTLSLISLVLFSLMQLLHATNNEHEIGKFTMMANDAASSVCVSCLALGQQDINLAHNGLQNKPSTSIRTTLLVICFFGMLNYFVYNAGMISFLMCQDYELPVDTLRDFISKPEYKLLVMGGTADESYFLTSKHDMHHKILSKIRSEGGIFSDLNTAEQLIKADSKKVLFTLSDFEDMYGSFPCEVVTPRESFGNANAAWPFNNRSAYIDLFSYHARRMVEAGFESRLHKREVQCADETFRSFGYEEVFSVFVISGFGFCIAIIHGLVEFASYHYKTKEPLTQLILDANNESSVENEIESEEL